MLKKVMLCNLLSLSVTSYSSGSENVLRMSGPTTDKMKFDPTNSDNQSELMVAQALNSSLIEIDDVTGEIFGDIAKKFYWKGNTLIFELREDIRSSRNHKITSRDVVFSLNRTISIMKKENKPLPGSIDAYLCPSDKEYLESNCSGIKAVDEFKVALQFPFKSGAFVEFLSHPIYSVAPLSSINMKSQKIEDFSDTTGRFFVSEKRKTDKYIELHRNHNYWNLPKSAPQKIRIFRDFRIRETGSWFSFDQIEKGHLDFIPPEDSYDPSTEERLRKKLSDFRPSFYSSDEIRSTILTFTHKGMSLETETRQFIANYIGNLHSKKKLLSNSPTDYKERKYKRGAKELFIPGSYGSFSNNDYNQLSKARSMTPTKWPKDLKITIGMPDEGWVKGYRESYFKGEKNVSIISVGHNIDIESQKEKLENVDLVVQSIALSFRETFLTVDALLRTHKLHLRGQEGEAWLMSFIKEQSPQIRAKMLNKIHYESVVTNPSIIPYFTRRRRAVAINGWTLDHIGPTTGTTKLWLMKKEK